MNYFFVRISILFIVGSMLAGYSAASKAESPAHSKADSAAVIPSLDELAGDWMEVGSLRNFPSVNNFWGALRTSPNLTAFEMLTFPPFANGGRSGALTVNGKAVVATESRWYPYQVCRRATQDGIAMESTIRMLFEQRGVMCRLTLKNTTSQSRTLDLSMEFSAAVARHPDGAWNTWESPHGSGGNTVACSENTHVMTGVDGSSAVAFAFTQPPTSMKAKSKVCFVPGATPFGGSEWNNPLSFWQFDLESRSCDGGIANWKITLAPGEMCTLGYTTAIDQDAPAATTLALGWARSFDSSFDQAQAKWEGRWQAAFTPGSGDFSGHFPTLVTNDPKIRRVYYEGTLVPLLMCRTDFPYSRRCFVTCGPEWANTLMYFWDTGLWENTWTMLEPVTMREHLAKWLTLDHHACYAADCMSGKGAGPWYAANDWSIFRCVEAYIDVTGDSAFLQQNIAGKTVLQHLDDIATYYEKRPLTKDNPLADYGGPGNLLECSPSYVQGVAALNAADVYMLRRTADFQKQAGNVTRAAELDAKARRLLPAVLALYEPGQGVWSAVNSAGKKVPIRHCFDYIVTGQALENDLTPTMKSQMDGFVERELLTTTWMRAMSQQDPAAPQSDRPDHGPLGSYDGWPPETMDVMCRFNDFAKATAFLRAVEPVTHEGPFAQSHEFLGPDSRGKNPVVRIAYRGGQDFNEGCGAAFAEVIIRSFFGFRPDCSTENPSLLFPNTPRGFNGQLRHVSYHGMQYAITSDEKGVHWEKE